MRRAKEEGDQVGDDYYDYDYYGEEEEDEEKGE